MSRSRSYSGTDLQSETMLRDISLILGAAFVIVTLIYVVFQKIENRPQPVLVPRQYVLNYIFQKTHKDDEFKYLGTLSRVQVQSEFVFFRQILRDGFYRGDIEISPFAQVYGRSKDGQTLDYLIFSENDTAIISQGYGFTMCYTNRTEGKRSHFIKFLALEDYPDEFVVKYFPHSCDWDGNQWVDIPEFNISEEVSTFEVWRAKAERIVFAVMKGRFEELLNE